MLLVLALSLGAQDVFAAESNIFTTIRDKAASSLKDIKLVVYIIGGFGLIGFAFMAIFNKISWKWFSSLAIGLFLVAVMGLFIDYFTGTNEHATMLDYGNYLNGDGSYTGNDGTSGGVKNPDISGEGNGDNTPPEDNSSPGDCFTSGSPPYNNPNCEVIRKLDKCTKMNGTFDAGTGNCFVNGQIVAV